MYKISVIIPTYNVEKYIEVCINSVINQTIGFDNIELIVVDDCSTDNTYKILEEYCKKYNNFFLFKTDKKSGVGGKPRNIGINNAHGKYLMFSDADDFFTLNACEIMYNAIEQKNADFIIANWSYADEDGTPYDRPIFDLERFKPFKLSINDCVDSFYVMNSSMCNKIFNREFIEKHNMRCLEYVPGEDTHFAMCAFLEADNVYYIDNIMYYYRQRYNENSCSTSFNCSLKYFQGMNVSYKAVYDKFKLKGQLNFYRFVYARNMTYLLYKFIDSTLLSDAERVEILTSMKWFYALSLELNVPACQKSLCILIEKIVNDKYQDAIDICKIIAEIRTYLPSEVKKKMSKPYEAMYKKMLEEKY